MRRLSSFARNSQGAVAVIFAIAAIPVVTAIGVAVDYARAAGQRTGLQQAVDAATLAASREMDNKTTTELKTFAQDFMNAALGGKLNASITRFDVNKTTRRVTTEASAVVPTVIAGLFNKSSVTIAAEAVAVNAQDKIEVALVLDNSGSMAGQRIIDLRAAANALVTELFNTPNADKRVKIALVPFAAMVNVGPANKTAAWMDQNGISPVASENFLVSAKRFSLYDAMRNVSWAGCVESRPRPYDVDDTPASTGTPATMFVPTFAPDEPDTSSSYPNDYLGDRGGACSGSSDNPNNESDSHRQAKICKYTNVTPTTSVSNGTVMGPNHLCDSSPIQPLTSNKTTITTAINNMTARGGTNILEGLMWGWRVLSPTAPFTDGVAYTDTETRKIIVLMSDGAQQWIGLNNMNRSYYSTFGYSVKNRLGTTSNSSSTLKTAMDGRWQQACTNIKAIGSSGGQNPITMYTIAFDIDDATGRSIMKACASNPQAEHYFEPETSGELEPVFKAIAASIGKPRLVN